MAEEFGYSGRILRVDLSSRVVSTIPTKNYADRFLGGRGVATKIYWDEVSPEVRAFDPENRLIFMTGPMADVSPGVAGVRWQLCGKSPTTDPEQFCYSNFGGDWGTELKRAGYDGLIVQGKSDKPVYVFIQDGSVEIKDASHLWCKLTTETGEMIKGELGEQVKVVTTGPAGDNMAKHAIALADHWASGTSGFGAVMGSKKLKAIAVRAIEKRKVAVANHSHLLELNRHIRQLLKTYPSGELDEYLLAVPEKRFRDVCRNCSLGCDRWVYEAKNGKRSKFVCEPSYFYTIRSKRYYEGKEDWTDVPFHAARLCNEYGLDVNALDATIYWLNRCYRAGILNDENTGIPLSKQGSMEYIDTLLRKISFRDGFGDVLAQGIVKAGELVGKGADKLITDFILNAEQNTAYAPRFYISTALIYAMEPRQPMQLLHDISFPYLEWVRWAMNKEGAYVSTDVLRAVAKKFMGGELAVDFSTYKGKALAAKIFQDRGYAKESMVLCDFVWPIMTPEFSEGHVGDPTLESQVLSAVLGQEIDEDGLYKIGERLFNLQRAVHVREVGVTDTLPEWNFTLPQKRVFDNPGLLAPGKDGEVFVKKDAVLDRQKFEEMKRQYYQLRQWDINSGLQTKAGLVELQLGDIAEELAQKGLAV